MDALPKVREILAYLSGVEHFPDDIVLVPRLFRDAGYSPITLQMKPIEMKKPENRAIRPRPP